ncbi:MAG: hypothetical protein RLZZ175_1790 [Bacteroidota bacterium]|jgi:hypothetical protein
MKSILFKIIGCIFIQFIFYYNSFSQTVKFEYHVDSEGVTIDTLMVKYDIPRETDKIKFELGSDFGLNDLASLQDLITLNSTTSGIIKLSEPRINDGAFYAWYICKVFLPLKDADKKVKYLKVSIPNAGALGTFIRTRDILTSIPENEVYEGLTVINSKDYKIIRNDSTIEYCVSIISLSGAVSLLNQPLLSGTEINLFHNQIALVNIKNSQNVKIVKFY